MQASVSEKEGAMLAILGMNINEVENEVSSFSKDGVCEISNDNSNTIVVPIPMDILNQVINRDSSTDS